MLAGDHFRTASQRLENGFVGPPPKHHRRRAAVSSSADRAARADLKPAGSALLALAGAASCKATSTIFPIDGEPLKSKRPPGGGLSGI